MPTKAKLQKDFLSAPCSVKLSLSELLCGDLIKVLPRKTPGSIDLTCHLNIIIFCGINNKNGNHFYPRHSSPHLSLHGVIPLSMYTYLVFSKQHNRSHLKQKLNHENVLPSSAHKDFSQKVSAIRLKFSQSKSMPNKATLLLMF